jgi:DNA processing protein
VLAGGHDKIYPAEHAAALERFLIRGAAISEMPFGWEARGRDFPRRNRIIAGLAHGSVIIEAAHRSGSLITARFAAEQGREVFAVPGSPLDPRAEGSNELIRDGATLCTSAQDVIDTLARQIGDLPSSDLLSDPAPKPPGEEPLWEELDLPEVVAPPSGTAEPTRSEFDAPRDAKKTPRPDATRQRIMALLGPSPISVDELARVAETPAREVRSILLELELAGRLERHGGDLFSLV